MQATQQIQDNAISQEPEERTNVAVRLPREVAKKLRLHAVQNETSIQVLLEQAVNKLLGEQGA
jgi:predicted HicB family RNase H-like nuclease